MKGSFEKKDVYVTAVRINGFKEYTPMFHSHLELVYVVKGQINVCIDGKTKTLSENEMSITFPYTIHSYDKSPEAEAIIVMFSPENAVVFSQELSSFKPESPYIVDVGEYFLPLLEKTVCYCATDERMTVAYLNVVVGEILQRLKLTKTENIDMTSAQQILIYCSEHYREDITVKSVATALYLSESYVSKVFSHKLGYSFHEYINTLRITKAKKLLKNSDLKITEVMYACGFTNQSSFNRVFFKETGYIPSKYKAKY